MTTQRKRIPRMVKYRELTAPALVKWWKLVVNDNVMMGRDAHLIKEFLVRATPVQILLGMYQYKEQRTVSIPMFLRQQEEWLELDEEWAEVELAVHLTEITPAFYKTFVELEDSWASNEITAREEARTKLIEWKEKVLG